MSRTLIRAARAAALGASLAAAAAAPAAAAPAAAQQVDAFDWPQLQGTPEHTGVADGPAPPYRTVWESPIDAEPGDVLLGPVVADGTAVVVSPTSVVALDLETGDPRWTAERDGPPSSPALADLDGTVAVVYGDGDDADTAAIVAVALDDGSPIWRAPLGAEPVSGVTIDDGRVFVADDDGTVYGIDVDDGSVAWTYRASGTVFSPPAASNGGVFVVAGSSEEVAAARVLGLEATTGERLWPPAVPDVAASFGSAPTVADDVVVAAFQDGVVYAVSAEDGSPSWSVRVGALVSPVSSPAAVDGVVFVLDRTGGLHRVDASGRDWLFAFNESALRQSPLVLGDAVVVGFEDGGIGAVDVHTGRMVFRTDPTDVPVTGIAVANDAMVVAQGGSGVPRVVAFENDPAGRLVDVASPTDVVPADLAASFGIALAVVAGVALVGGRLIRSRYELRDPSRDALPVDHLEEPM